MHGLSWEVGAESEGVDRPLTRFGFHIRPRCHQSGHMEEILATIVIDSVPFRLERPKFFIPVCKLLPEYPTFHLGSNFGPFQSIPVIPENSSQFRPRCKFRPILVLACY